MAERMTVVIQGQDELTVEDAMRQILDTFELVNRADPAAAELIRWQLVSATTNSPLTVIAEAVAVRPGVEVTRLAREQKRQFRRCVSELRGGKVPQAWGSPDSRRRARAWYKRTHNGIAATRIDTDTFESPITVTAQDASIAEPVLEAGPVSSKDQVGSVEGTLISVETHYHKPAIRIKDRRTGAFVLCIVPEEFQAKIATDATFEDVWGERRIIVKGLIHYGVAGKIEQVTATTVRTLPSRTVDISDIRDPDFTGGMPAEDYLDALRDGDIG